MIDLVLGLLVGVVVGVAVVLVRRRSGAAQATRAPEPEPEPEPEPTAEPEPEPVVEPVAAPEPVGVREEDPGCSFRVASDVLDVADRLTSAELRRRLGEALLALPGVAFIAPARGDAFDPDLHVWESTVDSETEPPESVARTTVTGLYAPDGTVARRARVAVHDRPAVPEPRSTP